MNRLPESLEAYQLGYEREALSCPIAEAQSEIARKRRADAATIRYHALVKPFRLCGGSSPLEQIVQHLQIPGAGAHAPPVSLRNPVAD